MGQIEPVGAWPRGFDGFTSCPFSGDPGPAEHMLRVQLSGFCSVEPELDRNCHIICAIIPDTKIYKYKYILAFTKEEEFTLLGCVILVFFSV